MSSGYAPWWRRILYHVPFLFKKCPEGNYHWFWDRLCFCRLNQCCGDFHGGVWDMKLKKEYQPYEICNPNGVLSDYIDKIGLKTEK